MTKKKKEANPAIGSMHLLARVWREYYIPAICLELDCQIRHLRLLREKLQRDAVDHTKNCVNPYKEL